MSPLMQVILGFGSLALFCWMMFSQTSTPGVSVTSVHDVIDPNNSYQIGFLIGMTGGTVVDAAVVRFALQRFEQVHGYKPTLRDAALVVGFMKTSSMDVAGGANYFSGSE